ncbi:MAG: endolytic transglycosylase MltG [Clostridia bacterium]|nr:endolytic transglycosylase MltG [Clostridia bacterium]
MSKRKDTYQSVRDEREYGPYWYSLLWRVVRPLLILAGSLLVVIGILSSIWNGVYENYFAPPEPTSQTSVGFTVESGQSLTRVANNLEAAGLIRSRTVFKYYCDFAGLGQKIQAGSYLLTPSMTMTEIADQLTRGDGNPIVRNITLIPGWTIENFAAKLVEDGVLADNAEFLEMCRTGTAFTDYYYVADVLAGSNVQQRRYVLEGYLSPNTYEVYVDATAEDIIRKLLSQTENAFPVAMQDQADTLGYTMDEVLILASIIEKEAKEGDFTRVSAVFHNRLRLGMPLQSDVTIHYVTGQREMALDDDDLHISSPYNTYEYAGLPPGPICAPSEAAIRAALEPDQEYLAMGYLYFCARDPASGELEFSITYEDHLRAVEKYAPLWREYDESRGVQ